MGNADALRVTRLGCVALALLSTACTPSAAEVKAACERTEKQIIKLAGADFYMKVDVCVGNERRAHE